MSFRNAFEGRRVVVTGDTGFKGSWLTTWLLHLGAEVVGIANSVPTTPAMYDALELGNRITHISADVRDLAALSRAIDEAKPELLFHLAAQAIVSRSYADPVETVTTNVLGTVNVLEYLRQSSRPCRVVIATSDKCYDNREWVWGYRETDALGGKDVYSGSKAAVDILVHTYVRSFFHTAHPVRIAVARAGNVIGGGDWARDRIVGDCMRAWSEGRPVEIRSPRATRPWQHVLEPLSGYLRLAAAMDSDTSLHGEAFNFGPRAEQNRTVLELLTDLARHWDPADVESRFIVGDRPFHEAGLLKLNCDKALARLQWTPTLHYEQTVRMIAEWYRQFYDGQGEMFALTTGQINEFERQMAH